MSSLSAYDLSAGRDTVGFWSSKKTVIIIFEPFMSNLKILQSTKKYKENECHLEIQLMMCWDMAQSPPLYPAAVTADLAIQD